MWLAGGEGRVCVTHEPNSEKTKVGIHDVARQVREGAQLTGLQGTRYHQCGVNSEPPPPFTSRGAYLPLPEDLPSFAWRGRLRKTKVPNDG